MVLSKIATLGTSVVTLVCTVPRQHFHGWGLGFRAVFVVVVVVVDAVVVISSCCSFSSISKHNSKALISPQPNSPTRSTTLILPLKGTLNPRVDSLKGTFFKAAALLLPCPRISAPKAHWEGRGLRPWDVGV